MKALWKLTAMLRLGRLDSISIYFNDCNIRIKTEREREGERERFKKEYERTIVRDRVGNASKFSLEVLWLWV